jgi:hypothetical protein
LVPLVPAPGPTVTNSRAGPEFPFDFEGRPLAAGLADIAGRLEAEAADLRRVIRLLDAIAAGSAEAVLIGRVRREAAERGGAARGVYGQGPVWEFPYLLPAKGGSRLLRCSPSPDSLIMRQLASYPRQNGLAAALRELGRLERTLFTLDWLEGPELRRQTSRELNKGESRNSLARAVFIHRLGEIRDRTYENQQHRASGLNLLVTAIILWNTRYLNRAIAALGQTRRR